MVFSVVSAYAGNEGQRIFRDPISGKVTKFNERIVDGWKIDTLPGGGMIIVSDAVRTVVFVTDWRDGGRQINVMGPDSNPIVTVTGDDPQHHMALQYGTGEFWSTDANFDGQPDTRLDLRRGSASVWYEGSWYLLRGNAKQKYIVVDGKRVAMQYKDGRFVRR